MLKRIHVRDFAVARDVSVEPGPGLNVFTGETGAGKSLIVDALAFVFGARKGREVIGAGAQRASVSALLSLGGETRQLQRSISAGGRSVARVDGAASTLDELSRLGVDAIDIHGQSEQLGLLRPANQRLLLDAFANLNDQRLALASRVRELRELRRSIQSLQTGERERERRIDQLRFEVDEITTAALMPGEDEALRQEQRRLTGSTNLITAAESALQALESSAMGDIVAAVSDIAAIDPEAESLSSLAVTIEATADDLRRELRQYRDGIEDDPARLETVAERLDLIARLRRKYGDSIEAILAYRDEASAELQRIENSDASLEELTARETSLAEELAGAATALSHARRNAAARLVGRVQAELELLGMGNGSLAIGFEAVDDPAGIPLALPDFERIDASWNPEHTASDGPANREITEAGADRVEFLATFNPGQDPRPLASVASGGETSRFLLALTAVFGATAEPRIVVLDEVDEGVGGRAGALVGEALKRLAARHQVLCITHLPQVAAYGDHHFVVAKQSDGDSTWSAITPVSGEDRIRELADMLGGINDANLAAARTLLAEKESPTQS